MKKIDEQLGRLQKAFEESIGAIRKEAERMDAASHVGTGKAVPLVACKLPDSIRNNSYIYTFVPGYRSGSFFHREENIDWKAAAAGARAVLLTAREELEKQHEANLPAIENNRSVIKQVKLLMTNLGIPESRTTHGYATARARKMTSTTTMAGYIGDLAAACPLDDEYEKCKQRLADFERRIDNYEREAQQKETLKKQQEEKTKAERAKLTLLGAMAHKYGVTPDVDSVTDALLKKDKYLHLAHGLQRNRADWNDGPSSAEAGLNGFSIETVEDQEIYDEIYGLISDWGGDGRVFRDCHYNYGYLFGMVDAELMADYTSLADAGFFEY